MIEIIKKHFFHRESARRGESRQSASQRRRKFYESIADGYGQNLAEAIYASNF